MVTVAGTEQVSVASQSFTGADVISLHGVDRKSQL